MHLLSSSLLFYFRIQHFWLYCFRAKEIEERLIKNKSLLNVVEPTLDNHCLDILLGILQRRIDCDKDALFQFTQLKKEAGEISSETQVAPLLLRYSRGCKEVTDPNISILVPTVAFMTVEKFNVSSICDICHQEKKKEEEQFPSIGFCIPLHQAELMNFVVDFGHNARNCRRRRTELGCL